MEETDVRRLVERYRDGWFDHDLEAIMAVVADDIVLQNVTAGERVEGKEAFREHVAAIFEERWPDISLTEHALYVADDTGLSEWTARATDREGRRIEWDGIDVINCRDGLIVRNAAYSSGATPRVLGP